MTYLGRSKLPNLHHEPASAGEIIDYPADHHGLSTPVLYKKLRDQLGIGEITLEELVVEMRRIREIQNSSIARLPNEKNNV